jgi:hypothetical protein
VGSRAGLDAVVKRKIPSPYWNWNPPIIQPVAQRYTTELFRLLIFYIYIIYIYTHYTRLRLRYLILMPLSKMWSLKVPDN